MEGNFNFWSILLLISIGQGLFLNFMLIVRRSPNPLSSRLLLCLIFAVVVVNIDYFLMSSSLYKALPFLIGISFGLMYLFGPLFYVYLRSVAHDNFAWKHVYWLHFLPWVANMVYNRGFYFLDSNIKLRIVDRYLAVKASATGASFYMMNSLQIAHLLIYLVVSYKFLRVSVKGDVFKIPLNARVNWLRTLFYANIVFVCSFLVWFLIACLKTHFIPPIDYINTLVCSAMVFLVAFKLVFNPEILTPGFEKKYKGSALSEPEVQKYLAKLNDLMENGKLYTELDLKLHEVADQVGVSPHVLSQLINQESGKSFLDYVNHYRVEAVKKLLVDPENANLTMLSIALRVGFNSKSAFNTAFKKFTGKSPTEYKKETPGT